MDTGCLARSDHVSSTQRPAAPSREFKQELDRANKATCQRECAAGPDILVVNGSTGPHRIERARAPVLDRGSDNQAEIVAVIGNDDGWTTVLLLVFYIAAVMATNLFGAEFPAWFGDVGASMFSLFQIMTLESWSMGIVRPVMNVYPFAWAFFVPFIIITSFTVLNLFIALIVNSMQTLNAETNVELHEEAEVAHSEREALARQIDALASEVRKLRKQMPD